MADVVKKATPQHEANPLEIPITPKKDDTKRMTSVQWHASKDIRVEDTAKPMISDPRDAIIKVSYAGLCGSDLHLFLGALPGMKTGDIMGHEVLGIVDDIGEDVKHLTKGDKVVVAFSIACGMCPYCTRNEFSGCDNTNPSLEQEKMYGHRTCGIFGYSQLTGGYQGGQASYLRVPLADINCMKILPDMNMNDKDAVLLSDILPTAWHANELAKVNKGDTLAIWGAGPVGILAAHCASVRGAKTIVLIDEEDYRLNFAKQKIPGVHTINFKKEKTIYALHAIFSEEVDTGGGKKAMRYIGPDCCIEAVGFHYASSWVHKFEQALKLETDPADMLNEMIYAVRKCGRIGVVGVYAGFVNHFAIGAFMEKGLTMAAGQTPVQKYWKGLADMIQKGELNPSMVVTHVMPLEDAAKAYKMFNEKKEGCVKILFKP